MGTVQPRGAIDAWSSCIKHRVMELMSAMGSAQPMGAIDDWPFCSKHKVPRFCIQRGGSGSSPSSTSTSAGASVPDLALHLAPRLATQLNCDHAMPRAQPMFCSQRGPSGSSPSSTSTSSKSAGASVPDLALHLAPRLATQLNCDHAMARAQPRFCIQSEPTMRRKGWQQKQSMKTRLGPTVSKTEVLQQVHSSSATKGNRRHPTTKAKPNLNVTDPPPLCDEKGDNTANR